MIKIKISKIIVMLLRWQIYVIMFNQRVRKREFMLKPITPQELFLKGGQNLFTNDSESIVLNITSFRSIKKICYSVC